MDSAAIILLPSVAWVFDERTPRVPAAADAPILAVMQSELERNFQVLSKEPSG